MTYVYRVTVTTPRSRRRSGTPTATARGSAGTARLVIPDLMDIVRGSKSTTHTSRVLQSVTGGLNYGDEATA